MATAHVTSTDVGLLVLRTGVGGVIFAHGALKLFGWFGEGGGLEATAAGFESIGFTPGRANALIAGTAETGSGALLILGLATPVASAAAAGTLLVAASLHRPNGFFFADGGYEFPATLAVATVALGISGPGALSQDARLGERLDRPWMRAVALALVGPAVTVVARRRARVLAARVGAVPADGPSVPAADGSSS